MLSKGSNGSRFFNETFTHEIKFWPKKFFSKPKVNKLWSNVSNAFSMSMVTKRPSFFILAIPRISDINLPLLSIYLFLINALSCEDTNLLELFLSKEVLISFLDLHSTKKWVASFEWTSYLYLFSVNLMIACLWEVLKCLYFLASDMSRLMIKMTFLKYIMAINNLSITFWGIVEHYSKFFSESKNQKKAQEVIIAYKKHFKVL